MREICFPDTPCEKVAVEFKGDYTGNKYLLLKNSLVKQISNCNFKKIYEAK